MYNVFCSHCSLFHFLSLIKILAEPVKIPQIINLGSNASDKMTHNGDNNYKDKAEGKNNEIVTDKRYHA